MNQIAVWLDGTSASLALKNALWVVPTVQSVHIMAVAFVFTAAVFVSMRAWGVAGVHWPMGRWVERLFPAQWWALAILLTSGSVLILAEPARELPNYVFQIKMVSVAIATLLSLWLGRRLASSERVGGLEKTACVLMVALWLEIIFAGRWIAYV